MKRKKSNTTRKYTVFLGLQFRSKFFDMSSMIEMVQNAVNIAQSDIQKTNPRVTLELQYLASKHGEDLTSQIVDMVCQATATIFEISDANRNVYFELGQAYATGASKPIILFNNKAKANVCIATDILGIFRCNYPRKNLDAALGSISRHIKDAIMNRLRQESRSDIWRDLKKVWGSTPSVKNITVVCPELPPTYRPKFAQRNSPEFVHLARFGDADALVEVLALIPKLFPHTEVKHITCEELQRNDREGNLIVIGGPDFNSLTKELMRYAKVPFQYKISYRKAEFINMKSKEKLPLKKAEGRICLDHGLFARFPNRLNPRNFIVLIGGLQTYGVLSAVRAFSASQTGRQNARRLLSNCKGVARFVVILPTNITQTQPSIPQVEKSNIIPYPWQ